jgi:hypothetical protein
MSHSVLAAAILALTLVLTPLRAASAATPTFSNPLQITNPYQPFPVGGVKVYKGKKDGKTDVVVDLFTADTRVFQVNGMPVTARILQETEFLDGQLIEISRNHLAQADDGTLYYFGELVDEYENGVIVNNEGSWLVGGATEPGDPPSTGNATTPTVFLPASPAVGDVFKQEDIAPIADETDTVKAIGLKVRVPAGAFPNCIQVLETTTLGDKPETKWYARGIGPIKSKTPGETSALIASTLLPQ